MKYCGIIGFSKTVDKGDGITDTEYTERKYYGDVLRNTHRWQSGNDNANNEFNVSNQISIIIDDYLMSNLGFIEYITWMNSKWKVTNITVEYPRVTLEVGGVFNE